MEISSKSNIPSTFKILANFDISTTAHIRSSRFTTGRLQKIQCLILGGILPPLLMILVIQYMFNILYSIRHINITFLKL